MCGGRMPGAGGSFAAPPAAPLGFAPPPNYSAGFPRGPSVPAEIPVPGYQPTGRRIHGFEEARDASGAPVLLLRQLFDLTKEIEAEQLCGVLAKSQLDGLVRVRQVNPWVLEPPRGAVRDTVASPFEHAIDLTIQLLDRIGRVHAAGGVELSFSPSSMWVDDDRAQTLTLVVPAPAPGLNGYWTNTLANVTKDLWCAASQLTHWLKPTHDGPPWTAARARVDHLRAQLAHKASTPGPAADLLLFLDTPGGPSAPRTARELARLLAAVSDYPSWWSARVEAIANVRHVRRHFDWDAVIARAERALAEREAARPPPGSMPQGPAHALTYPLARAYQQRARRRYAAKDFAGAEVDIRRAVENDPEFEDYRRDLAIMAAPRA